MPESVSNQSMRIKWTEYPNTNVRTLHVDVILWDSIHADCYQIPLTDDQRWISENINGIRGITDVGFKKYEIRITKGEVFQWDEICHRVESVFAEWQGISPAAPVASMQRDA